MSLCCCVYRGPCVLYVRTGLPSNGRQCADAVPVFRSHTHPQYKNDPRYTRRYRTTVFGHQRVVTV